MMTSSPKTESMTERSDVVINTKAFDVKNIKSIQLADGWHNISDCSLTQFAVGEAHSPIYPSKLYPTLRYKNENGAEVYTPLSNVLSFSDTKQI